MTHKLSVKDIGENSAHAVGRNLDISFKESKEVCNFVRKKPVAKAKSLLRSVLDEKIAVPFKCYNDDLGHKPGIGPGRYPLKCTKNILLIIESAEQNALHKGLSASDLVITHINAHRAATPWHYGRQRRRKMKRSNIEVVLTEVKEKKESKKKDDVKEDKK